ncbi:(2Fe-2S) ferredoxin domain-containing protein [Planosporangium mesophilum]|uniref:(2Fe-2S) ferredoxin domain-containing protein n=1 Tax=Planosporangium mesophilum TaxID=689768 RepID=UPI004032902C
MKRTRAGAGCTVTVCRGCCCGTTAKHPDVDHAGQLARLRGALVGVAQVRVSDCLDVCEHSNVVVVSPSPAGRKAGARPVWLGFVLDDGAVDDIAAWVGSGGPGLADPPVTVDLYAFTPPRRAARAAER